MATKASPEKILRTSLQVALALFVIAAVVAYMQYAKSQEIQAALDLQKQDAANAAASSKKTADELRAAKTKAADSDRKLADADGAKARLAAVEGQIKSALEAAAGAKGAKPDARGNALAAEGVVMQLVHGAGDADALAVLDKALAADKANCAAVTAINLSGTKKVDVPDSCPALVATAPATAATAATPTASSPATAAAPAPTASAAKAAPALPADQAGASKADAKK